MKPYVTVVVYSQYFETYVPSVLFLLLSDILLLYFNRTFMGVFDFVFAAFIES